MIHSAEEVEYTNLKGLLILMAAKAPGLKPRRGVRVSPQRSSSMVKGLKLSLQPKEQGLPADEPSDLN